MRRKACIICSTSPQISESKPDLPPSKTPTTVHSRPAKRSDWPMLHAVEAARRCCVPTIDLGSPGLEHAPVDELHLRPEREAQRRQAAHHDVRAAGRCRSSGSA